MVGDHHAVLAWVSLLVGVAITTLRGRHALLAENLLLRQQLAVALRTARRPRRRWHDRLFWVVARGPVTDWRRHLVLVQPETVLRWHRRGWRRYWRWRSRRPRGRPRVPPDVRALIRRLSEENRLWGTERIRGELRPLGVAVCNGPIRRYRWRPAPRPPAQTWATFLRNHAAQIWAADLCAVTTVTCRTLYVLFFMTHDRRQLVHCRVTAHPPAAWVWRQLVEATPWDRRPRYLARDRDAVYGRDFPGRARGLGIRTLLPPFRAPRANATAERVSRTRRTECLDRVLVLNERHLDAVLQECATHYNRARPHRPLGLLPPAPGARAVRPLGRAPERIIARPVLGGLHHVYERAA
jgi:putative transposase